MEYFNWFGSDTNQDSKVISKIGEIIDKDPEFDVIFSHISDLDSTVHKSKLSSKEAIEAIDRDQ